MNNSITDGYAPVNGLEMYYRIEGTGDPVVFIHPALGYAGLESFPALTRNRSLITMDLQGHGRTDDIPERPLSIEQYARDVIALLDYLDISNADFFGESYGGNTPAMIAIRYPQYVRRVVTYSATLGPADVAHNPAMVRFDVPPGPLTRDTQFRRESYEKVARNELRTDHLNVLTLNFFVCLVHGHLSSAGPGDLGH